MSARAKGRGVAAQTPAAPRRKSKTVVNTQHLEVDVESIEDQEVRSNSIAKNQTLQMQLESVAEEEIRLLLKPVTAFKRYIGTELVETDRGTVLVVSARARSPGTFPFLELPGEIRNNIYKVAFYPEHGSSDAGSSSVQITKYKLGKKRATKRDTAAKLAKCKTPEMLWINRQVREEALPFIYRGRTFEIYGAWGITALNWFLDIIGSLGRSNIEGLNIEWSINPPCYSPARRVAGWKICPLLYECTRLRTLVFRNTGYYFNPAPAISFSDFPKIPVFHTLHKLRGLKSVTFQPSFPVKQPRLDLVQWLGDAMLKPREDEEATPAATSQKRKRSQQQKSASETNSKKRKVIDSA